MNIKYIGVRYSARDHGIPFARVNCRDRQGVALILVIGMLALMVVLGITFSIYMRTERVAAGSFKSGVVARQLLPVALNRALDAINNDLGNKPYPSWNVLESGNGVGVAVSGVNNTNVMAWIPGAALGPNQNPSPRWVDAGVDGRVGYLVVNCSGLLDANTSGNGVTPRGNGVGINEIQLSACQDVADAAALVAGRPYETIQEFGVKGLTSGALNQPVSNFVCYSYFPTGYVGGTNITLVDLSGDENALTNRHADIVRGLTASGIAASQAEFVYQNLLDYVDADDEPRDLGSPCTELVPMFNEILVTNTYRFLANTNFDMRGRVYAEWFYPFLKTSAKNFWIEYNATFERANATPPTFPLPASVTGVIDSVYSPGLSFAASTPTFNISISNSSYAAFIGMQVQLKAKINLKMHANNSTGPVVDASPSRTNLTIDLTMPAVTVPNPPNAVNLSSVTDAEVVDPRFNWDPAQWSVRANNNTLALTNTATKTWLTARDTDGYAGMYVANRPLVGVAELTYLLRGQTTTPTDYRWNTIHLFDWVSPSGVTHPIDRILDYFTLGTNTSVKGFVNPNSSAVDVLTAVFTDMPVNNYPGETPITTLTPAQARALAGFWADTNQNPARCNFTMLSDIGHATNVFNTATVSGWTPFQKTSIIRNSAGLFNTRQQYFIILLYAQAAKYVPQMDDKSVMADVRAVAEVWRDPLPNAEGIHPCVVRMVLPLNND